MIKKNEMKGGLMRRFFVYLTCVSLILSYLHAFPKEEDLLKGSSKIEREGWFFLHLEGTPFQIGYQYGFFMGLHIEEALENLSFYLEKDTGKKWKYYKSTAKKLFLPKVPEEYKEEMRGIVEGMKAIGVKKVDFEDILALNSWMEIAWYYLPFTEPKKKGAPSHCSAFIATGDATKDGNIVMAHNTWIDYVTGRFFNVFIDLKPANGNRVLMQSYAGFIHSGSDWYISSSGLMVTETTIVGFKGFNPNGTPEFVRARKAIQYANSIDEWVKIMIEDNNGGYANSWLIGDRKTGEIACLELGLKNHSIKRTKNGYFAGSNIAFDEKVREETDVDYSAENTTAQARYRRWKELLDSNYGKIDVDLAKSFISDHYDVVTKSNNPSARTLCGHIELDPKGEPSWERPPYYPEGAIDAKVTDSVLSERMMSWAIFGHPCGLEFNAKNFLEKKASFKWMKDYLKDINKNEWVLFGIK